MKTLRFFLTAALVAFTTMSASAQVVTKPTVGLALAKKIAARAGEEAAKNKWTVVIAIVDDGGNLILLEKIDGTQNGSIEVAIQKAKTAVNFKRATKVFEDGVAGGRNAILSLPGVVAIEGGLPLIVDGNVIGAIGVSGVKSNEDGIIAAAGATVLAKP